MWSRTRHVDGTWLELVNNKKRKTGSLSRYRFTPFLHRYLLYPDTLLSCCARFHWPIHTPLLSCTPTLSLAPSNFRPQILCSEDSLVDTLWRVRYHALDNYDHRVSQWLHTISSKLYRGSYTDLLFEMWHQQRDSSISNTKNPRISWWNAWKRSIITVLCHVIASLNCRRYVYTGKRGLFSTWEYALKSGWTFKIFD